jgi:hypothetical protein
MESKSYTACAHVAERTTAAAGATENIAGLESCESAAKRFSLHGEVEMYLYRTICSVQGAYFLLTGVWPIVSIETFQLVTGRKTDHLVTGREADHWLVNTVGVLVIAIGVTLLSAAWRGTFSADVSTLAIASAIGLICIDIVYYARGTISAVYLVDAALEAAFVTGWAVWFFGRSRGEAGRK